MPQYSQLKWELKVGKFDNEFEIYRIVAHFFLWPALKCNFAKVHYRCMFMTYFDKLPFGTNVMTHLKFQELKKLTFLEDVDCGPSEFTE